MGGLVVGGGDVLVEDGGFEDHDLGEPDGGVVAEDLGYLGVDRVVLVELEGVVVIDVAVEPYVNLHGEVCSVLFCSVLFCLLLAVGPDTKTRNLPTAVLPPFKYPCWPRAPVHCHRTAKGSTKQTRPQAGGEKQNFTRVVRSLIPRKQNGQLRLWAGNFT